MGRWLRNWPPITWLFIYVASLLVLMGSRRVDLGAIGIGLLAIGFGIALYLAGARDPERPRPPGLVPALGLGALFFLIIAAAAASNGWWFAIAAILGGLVPLTATALAFATARSKTRGEQGRLHDVSPEDDSPFPAVGMDQETPLGDTPEAHDEISPHDLPPDHPGRKEAEREASRRGGTTPGNR
jgi:hypothetical protein